MNEHDESIRTTNHFDYTGFYDLRYHANRRIRSLASDLLILIQLHAERLCGDEVVGGDPFDPVMIAAVLNAAWRQSLQFWLNHQTDETPPAVDASTPEQWLPVRDVVKQSA